MKVEISLQADIDQEEIEEFLENVFEWYELNYFCLGALAIKVDDKNVDIQELLWAWYSKRKTN